MNGLSVPSSLDVPAVMPLYLYAKACAVPWCLAFLGGAEDEARHFRACHAAHAVKVCRAFRCGMPGCAWRCTARAAMLGHMARNHSAAERGALCRSPGCAFWAPTEELLCVHMRVAHALQRPRCSTCGKQFANAARLKAHHARTTHATGRRKQRGPASQSR